MESRREFIRLPDMCPVEESRSTAFPFFCLFWIAFETMSEPNDLTCATDFLNLPPKKTSVTCHRGFWNLSPVAPEAKSKAAENGSELWISTWNWKLASFMYHATEERVLLTFNAKNPNNTVVSSWNISSKLTTEPFFTLWRL